MILLPATTAPTVNECMARVAYTSGGFGPLTCPNGGINVNAWNDISGGPYMSVLALGPRVTSPTVGAAMCSDVHRFKYETAPMEIEAERLAAIYYGWRLPTDPATQFPYYCSTK